MTRPKSERRKAERNAATLLAEPVSAEEVVVAEPLPDILPEEPISPEPQPKGTRVSWLRWRTRNQPQESHSTEELAEADPSVPLLADDAEDLTEDPTEESMASPVPPAGTTPSTEALWQARALRYCFIYVLLACAVLTLRYTTQNTYPQLRDLRQQVSDLQTQRDTLDLQVQQLTTGPRVLDWAKSRGMIPYAQARKQSQEFSPLSAPPTPAPATPLEMDTQWK